MGWRVWMGESENLKKYGVSVNATVLDTRHRFKRDGTASAGVWRRIRTKPIKTTSHRIHGLSFIVWDGGNATRLWLKRQAGQFCQGFGGLVLQYALQTFVLMCLRSSRKRRFKSDRNAPIIDNIVFNNKIIPTMPTEKQKAEIEVALIKELQTHQNYLFKTH